MASCRILNQTAQSSRDSSAEALVQAWLLIRFLGILILIGIFITSCGTTRKSSRDADTGNTSDGTAVSTDEGAEDVSQEFIAMLNTNRSSLADVYSTRESEMPDQFLEEASKRDIGDPSQGYRIQILSTKNVAEADSTASKFRFWAVDKMEDYVPEAYVLYRQPYYKVHVGNFQFQDQAMQLNSLIKKEYPDAWVVPDEVEPDLVPADTLMFGEEEKK